ncbi:hypothetical protein MesoLjLc_29960 [Mesorhizobium sp. L-8-10]|uniref:hypothetical protein n=1 Tax=Mesorhizobium sp. L-8-10 TaxID=2744523 RepID=UPI0019259B51|nr:hypothetical protein [Mesorhizobium sp. L-8-10]BCH31066.1 hypothetical protein MesoLjLc_29960 [Mesorhizobium sp. L-8-10]
MTISSLRITLIAAAFGAVMLQSAAADDTNKSIDDLLGDHTVYQAAISALQKGVTAHDAAAVAALVRYPISVAVKGKKMAIKSPKDFIAHYDAIMTPEISKAVTDQKYADLMVNSQGIMFGNGQVWINGICKDDACNRFEAKVITIQSAGPE